MADRDEDFNTRYASYRGWQMAIEKVKPIPRDTAQLDLTAMVHRRGLQEHHARWSTTSLARFLRVPLDAEHAPAARSSSWTSELGTDRPRSGAARYMEEPLRMLLHLIMSTAGISARLDAISPACIARSS